MNSYVARNLPGRTVTLENGKEYFWFSGTDYLGMGRNESFRTYLIEGISRLGTHFGSSRNNSLQLSIYAEVENELAKFTGAPTALTLSSGMWAGQILIKEIENIVKKANPHYTSFQYHYAPGVHPAIQGKNYSTSNLNWRTWAKETIASINSSNGNIAHIICTDSVGSPWVQNFDFSIFSDLRENAWFIVDDSHGLGARGTNGSGIYGSLQYLQESNVIVCGSLNKGMGVPAGVILGPKSAIDYLKTTSWYAGASPCVPAYAYALRELLLSQTYQQCFDSLKANVYYFQDQTTRMDLFNSIEGYPVFCSKNPALFDYLLSHDIMASRFPYPSLTDEPITRLAITASHTKKDLDRLAEVCEQFYKESFS